jgi:hypothetical protein
MWTWKDKLFEYWVMFSLSIGLVSPILFPMVFMAGMNYEEKYMQKQMIKKGCARFNPKTGKFEIIGCKAKEEVNTSNSTN